MINRKTIFEILLLFTISFAFFSHRLPENYQPPLPVAEQEAYFNVALNLYNHGTFSNIPYLDGDNFPADRFFAPIFPSFITLLMYADKDFAETVNCTLRYQYISHGLLAKSPDFDTTKPHQCKIKSDILINFNLIFISLTMVIAWLTVKTLSKSSLCSWASIFLIFAIDIFGSAILTESIKYYLSDLMCLMFYTCFLFLLVSGAEFKNFKAFGFAAFFLALSALTRPQFGYIYYVFLPLGLFFIWSVHKKYNFLNRFSKNQLSFSSKAIKIFLVAFIVTIGPWAIRNMIHFKSPSLTSGYGPYALSVRAGYNDITAKEYFFSFLYWIPNYGPLITSHLTDNKDLARLNDWNSEPMGFAKYGMEVIHPQAIADGHPMKYYAKLIASNPFKYLAITLPFVWRSLLFDSYLSILGVVAIFFMVTYSIRRKWYPFIFFIIPSIFMLLLQSFITASITRYNIGMLPCLTFCIAFSFLLLAQKFTKLKIIKKS